MQEKQMGNKTKQPKSRDKEPISRRHGWMIWGVDEVAAKVASYAKKSTKGTIKTKGSTSDEQSTS